MKRLQQLKVNSRGVISGVGMAVAASVGGSEYILVAKNLRTLVRVWGEQNPGRALKPKQVRKVEIRRA